MLDVIYAMDNSEDIINIGFSEHGPRRIRDHERNGFELLAVWPGTYPDEQALHDLLKPFREPGRGKENYRGEAVYDYVTGLLARGYAAATYEDATTLPRLPFRVWKFGADLSHIRHDGQMSLLQGFTPRERPRYVSDLAWISSESDEWFTPPTIIELARQALGTIDTDPASCAAANKVVRADTWYGREQDGLDPQHPWHGNVWLNPPYGRGGAAAFTERLCTELAAGNVHQAITCLNIASMSSLWFDKVAARASVHCITRGRINFIPPGGTTTSSSTKGTTLSYFGDNDAAFTEYFGPLGHILTVRRTPTIDPTEWEGK